MNPNVTLYSCLILIMEGFISEVPDDELEHRIALELTLVGEGFDLFYSCTYKQCTNLAHHRHPQLSHFSNIDSRVLEILPPSYFLVADAGFLSLKITTEHCLFFGSATSKFGDQVCLFQANTSLAKHLNNPAMRDAIIHWAARAEEPLSTEVTENQERQHAGESFLSLIEAGFIKINSEGFSR